MPQCLRPSSVALGALSGEIFPVHVLGEDADEEFAVVGDVELGVDTFDAGVDGVDGDAELEGDLTLDLAIEDVLHDLQLARRRGQSLGDPGPLPGR
jgi:hypothetical protein